LNQPELEHDWDEREGKDDEPKQAHGKPVSNETHHDASDCATRLGEGAMLRYLKSWIDQLRWQRLKPMEKLARMLLDHLEGILNYCRIEIPPGVVEAVNGNIKALLRRGRGYRDLNYLLLKAQRLAATKTEFVAFRKAA
jgi:transposase